jgi:hypothetical protein
MSARDVIADWWLSYGEETWAETDSAGLADAILSALRSAGWAVVPTVPSLAMCWAGEKVPDTRLTSEVYKAMIKAAQEDSRE